MSERDVVLRVEHISKAFTDPARSTSLDVLDDVDFSIHDGELVAIVGPSGCGKTTLLRLLAGFDKPTKGSIWVKPELRDNSTAVISQSAALLPWRTLFQNACLGLEIRRMMNVNSIQYIRTLIDEYGLAGFDHALPHQLSGGMRQRVAVIRALGSRPRLLLCDEPFSSIDFVTRLELSTLFRHMCRARRITMVIVTHNIEEALFLGERVIVMSGRPGRVVAIRNPFFSVGRENAVRSRESPEFWPLFRQVWNDLKEHHAG